MVIPEHEIQFEYMRSSGPGGQNVNKVSSKVRLRWNVLASRSLADEVRNRFLTLFGNRLTKAGEIVLTSDRTRDQAQNRADCLRKLALMLEKAAHEPKARKATKPTRTSREKRFEKKKRHSQKKRMRTKKNWD